MSYNRLLLLINTLVFSCNGLDEQEDEVLINLSGQLGIQHELPWAMDFIKNDMKTAFLRTKDLVFSNTFSQSPDTRLRLLTDAWKNSLLRGYVNELEAIVFIKLSKILEVESDFISTIRD
ncbi:MAG: hypothetical protein NW207_11955 [Cytophagales bacterium]|nr:hypothetical protein [Cytophagales bacterium]